MIPALPSAIRRHADGLPWHSDSIGCSGAQVLIYPDMVLKIRPESEPARRDYALLHWLNGRIPAPMVIESVQDGGRDYLLMTRLHGRVLCEDDYLDNPRLLCELLTEGMTLMHQADTDGCPVDRCLDVVLREAEDRVIRGLCTPEAYAGFGSPEKLLQHLKTNRPEERVVLTHGDYCLPNVLAEGSRVTGLIDLGDAGLADPYTDIALGYQSPMRNLSGFFGGPARPLPDKRLLFDCLGITPDWEKLEYYLLLERLFW